MIDDVHTVGGRDPHDVLDVPRGADRQQVIRAFHRKARRGAHPDTGGDARAFEEIVRARDALLERAHRAARGPVRRATTATPRAGTAPSAEPRPDRSPSSTARNVHHRTDHSPPRETSKLAIATAVLALLGPLFWPFAIAVGHLALRRIRRTGQGGGTLVAVVLLFLYILTLPVLARILVVLIP